MAYSTKTDVLKLISETELAQLTYDSASGDPTVDDAKVSEAIAKADAWIDTKLAKRYPVPLSTIPEIVKDSSAAIAVWHLRGRRQDGIDDTTQAQYDHYAKIFEDIANGEDDLPGIEEASEGEAGTSSVMGNKRVFTRDTLRGF